MFTDIINTMKFDITCSKETTASDIERIVVNDTVNSIAEILEQVSIAYNDTDLKQIDKIEIDLGDITAKAFTDFTFSDQVRALLIKEIEGHEHHKITFNIDSPPAETSVMARRDLVKEFLLFGGLPWWADKNYNYILDEILQELLLQSPAVMLPVLAESATNATVRYRLQTQFSSSTRKMISDLLPLVYNYADNIDHLPADDAIIPAANGHILHGSLMATLSWLLTRHAGQFVWHFINHLGNLTQDELSMLKTYAAATDVLLRNKVQAVFLKLTMPQLSFLWQLVTLELPQAEDYAPAGGKTLTHLAEKLQCDESALGDLLQTFSPQQIHTLRKEIDRDGTEAHLKHKLANLIATHPDLLKRAFKKIPSASLAARDKLTAEYILSQGHEADSFGHKFFTGLFKRQPATVIAAAAQFAVGESQSVPYTAAETKKIVIENGGLCLIAPYLPALFKHLNYLQNNRFKTANTAHRALLLLQYAATGQKNFSEYTLQLNKLLCGIGPTEPVPVRKRLKLEEKQEADELLLAIINNWVALKNTSAEGLRSSFLQRKGLLFENEYNWTLQIEKKAYDVLLDSLPWAFNLIKLPWMKKAIQVEW